MVEQYRAWIMPDGGNQESSRAAFFTDALVVLDTNVLLSLYEFNPSAREQVFAALEQVSERLWLPHQVGLEFARGRHRVISARADALKDAPAAIDRKFQQARQAVIDAVELVKGLLDKNALDGAAHAEIDAQINPKAVDNHLAEWRSMLREHVTRMRGEQDLKPTSISSADPVLPRVAALFRDRIADPTPLETVRERLDEAHNYRFPNRIPPGFMDAGKGTQLDAAGDFLLWAEVVAKAKELAPPRRVLLVSADGKGDWYEQVGQGPDKRPRPMLFDELKLEAAADLRLEKPRQFFEGIKQFLNPDVELAPTTYDEIDRVAEAVAAADAVGGDRVDDENAAVSTPPDGLALAAYRAAGLTTGSVRRLAESAAHRQFQWWLIGATAELRLREARIDEPDVRVLAAVRAARAPGLGWHPGEVLALGEWPYRGDSWIAPWFVQVLRASSEADRVPLQRLAARLTDMAAQG
jgi:hypothetical protein